MSSPREGVTEQGHDGEVGFGLVQAGERREASFVLRNDGKGPVTIDAVEWVLGSPTVELTAISDPVIQGGQERQVHLALVVPAGPFQSILRVRSHDSSGHDLSLVKVTGSGFTKPGPDLLVSPSGDVAFGSVALLPEHPIPVTRRLRLLNVGAPGADGDSSGDLKIEKIETRPLIPEAFDDELEASLPADWDPNVGLPPRADRNWVDLEVRINPVSAGTKRWELTIVSNDPDQPRITLEVSAEAVESPSCSIEVTPNPLDFGTVLPPEFRDQEVTLRNVGTVPNALCGLWGFEVGSDTTHTFSLPHAPIGDRILRPGEELRVTVRAHPLSVEPEKRTGVLELHTSSSSRPLVSVPLSSSIPAGSCLNIAPKSLDFGTVKEGCSSANRTFNLYNTCSSSAVQITSFAISNAAGQPAGGPNCPGSAPCPEFIMVQSPTVPQNLSGTTPLPFQIKYRPIDNGADNGSVAVNAIQNGVQVTYIVPLLGNGDNTSMQTDVFVQDARPMADILIVIDNSATMAPLLPGNATNFAQFLQYAVLSQVDFHLAVVTADPAGGGVFRTGPTHPEAVLTRTTPNLAAKFADKVDVGASGSAGPRCLETALEALTSPLITGQNAGFLRNDAALAVLCVTSTADQSPLSVNDYVNGFWGIKGLNRTTLFSFNAVGGFSSACPGDTGALATAVALTNGVKEDVCLSTWHQALEKYGTTAWGSRTNFFLTSVPNLTRGPIEIRIDGVLLPSTNAQGQPVWTYDAVANSVNFDPMYVPEPGTTMEVTYWTLCYQ